MQLVNLKQRSAATKAANPPERWAGIEGTRRALPADMYDADAIEAINIEQLATITDRILLRGGRMSKRRPSIPSLVPLARGSYPHIERAARGSQPRIAPTTAVRAAGAPRSQVFAITVVIPTLVGIAVGLAAML